MVEFLSKFRKFYRSAIFQREDASPSAVASCRGSLAEGIISSRVHSLSILQLYPEALSPDSYRRKNISWSRSAGRQMLVLLCPCYPYSLESKIFTEAFSTLPRGGWRGRPRNIRLFVEKVAAPTRLGAFEIYARRISLLVCASKVPEAWVISRPSLD